MNQESHHTLWEVSVYSWVWTWQLKAVCHCTFQQLQVLEGFFSQFPCKLTSSLLPQDSPQPADIQALHCTHLPSPVWEFTCNTTTTSTPAFSSAVRMKTTIISQFYISNKTCTWDCESSIRDICFFFSQYESLAFIPFLFSFLILSVPSKWLSFFPFINVVFGLLKNYLKRYQNKSDPSTFPKSFSLTFSICLLLNLWTAFIHPTIYLLNPFEITFQAKLSPL